MTSLHVHDHGGDGPPVLLLHGAGRSLADWRDITPALTAGHRVLAVDLPGHGRSPEPERWSFDTVLRDIEETLRRLGAPEAAVVGHSLGGMVAALYAEAHPGVTPAAVNLDGFGWGRPGQYPGAERVREMGRASAGAVRPVDHISQEGAYAAQFGIPAERAEAAALGAVRQLSDGRWQTLPERRAALELHDALDALDVMDLLHRVPCPLLVVRGARPQPPAPDMEWFDELLATYGRGLTQELRGLAADRPTVTVVDIDATHAMLLEAPDAVAALVRDFLTRTA